MFERSEFSGASIFWFVFVAMTKMNKLECEEHHLRLPGSYIFDSKHLLEF